MPEYLAFAHYGVSRNIRDWCHRAERQLRLWLTEVEQARSTGDPFRPEKLTQRLRQVDPDFATLDLLDPDIRERELYYVRNSLNGMWKSFD